LVIVSASAFVPHDQRPGFFILQIAARVIVVSPALVGFVVDFFVVVASIALSLNAHATRAGRNSS
jgi:hypothetical protein